MWHKIEELAKQNPQVNTLRCTHTFLIDFYNDFSSNTEDFSNDC